VALPEQLPAFTKSLDEVMFHRHTARAFAAERFILEQLAKVLTMSYGVNRSNEALIFHALFV